MSSNKRKRKKSNKRYGGTTIVKSKILNKSLAKQEAELREELKEIDKVKKEVDDILKTAH